MSGKPYCWECGTLREYCDCDVYDALAEDDDLLDENLAAIAMEARQGGDGETRLHPKDDSAGPQDIAQNTSRSIP